MSEVPNPEEVAASEKEAVESKKLKAAAAKKAEDAKLETVDLTEQPTTAENLITKANAAALRQEEANTEHARLNEETKAMKVEQTLGGNANAGGEPQVDENAGAKKLLAGTGYEDMFDPPKPPEKK